MFEHKSEDTGFVYNFKTEANYMLASVNDRAKSYYEDLFNNILPVIQKIGDIVYDSESTEFGDECMSFINKFYNIGLFTPLTLNDEEFTNGDGTIQTNKRYGFIYRKDGIVFNNNAYNIVVRRKYNADNCEELENGIFEAIDQERVYISKGGVITGEYILDCIIPKHIVDSGKFSVQSVVKLPCSRIHYDCGRVIYTIDHRDSKLKALREFYTVPIYVDNNVSKFKLDIRKYKKL